MFYKKEYGLTTLLFLTVFAVGCGKIEFVSQTPGGNDIEKHNKIYFLSGVEAGSRAFTEATANELETTGWNCLALVNGTSELFNETLSFIAGTFCSTSKTYFHPDTGTTDFFGCWPVSFNIDASEGVKIDYIHNSDVDLIVAKNLGVVSSSLPVPMNFRHILSRVSVYCKAETSDADYKVKGIYLTVPIKGIYDMITDEWRDLSTSMDLTIFSSSVGTNVGNSQYSAVGSSGSYIPCEASLRIVWECYSPGTSTVVGSYDRSVSVTLKEGYSMIFNLLLPNDSSSDVDVASTVQFWQEEDKVASVS